MITYANLVERIGWVTQFGLYSQWYLSITYDEEHPENIYFDLLIAPGLDDLQLIRIDDELIPP